MEITQFRLFRSSSLSSRSSLSTKSSGKEALRSIPLFSGLVTSETIQGPVSQSR